MESLTIIIRKIQSFNLLSGLITSHHIGAVKGGDVIYTRLFSCFSHQVVAPKWTPFHYGTITDNPRDRSAARREATFFLVPEEIFDMLHADERYCSPCSYCYLIFSGTHGSVYIGTTGRVEPDT